MSSITPSRQAQVDKPHSPSRVDTNNLPGKLSARVIRKNGGLDAQRARELFESVQQALSALPQDSEDPDSLDVHVSRLSLSSTSRLNESECLISLKSADAKVKREGQKLICEQFNNALNITYEEGCFWLTIDCKKIQSQYALPRWTTLVRKLLDEKVAVHIVLDKVNQEEVALLRDALPPSFSINSLRCVSDKEDKTFLCSKQLANFDLSQLSILDVSECSIDSGFYNSLQSHEDLIQLLTACPRLSEIKGLSSPSLNPLLVTFLAQPTSSWRILEYDFNQELPKDLLKLLFERTPRVNILKIQGCQSCKQLTELFQFIKTCNTTVTSFHFASCPHHLFKRFEGVVKLHFTNDPLIMNY